MKVTQCQALGGGLHGKRRRRSRGRADVPPRTWPQACWNTPPSGGPQVCSLDIPESPAATDGAQAAALVAWEGPLSAGEETPWPRSRSSSLGTASRERPVRDLCSHTKGPALGSVSCCHGAAIWLFNKDTRVMSPWAPQVVQPVGAHSCLVFGIFRSLIGSTWT